MRTTLQLDDEVLRRAKYAQSRSISVGKAVSELLRRGLAAPTPARRENGLLVVDVPKETPAVSGERVKELQLELDSPNCNDRLPAGCECSDRAPSAIFPQIHQEKPSGESQY